MVDCKGEIVIKNIFLITVLVFSADLYGMKQSSPYDDKRLQSDGPMSFVIQTDRLNARFRQIDLRDLANPIDAGAFSDVTSSYPTDRETFMEHLGDFDAVENMLGMFPAVVFKGMHAVSPQAVLEIFITKYADRYRQMPLGQKNLYLWFIEDLDSSPESAFVGKFLVSTYVDDRPADYADTLFLEIGLALSEKYRNKGITSQLFASVLEKLAMFTCFQDGVFCFDTRTDNEPVHKIASKLGAELIYRRDKEVDFIVFKKTIPFDLFIISRQ